MVKGMAKYSLVEGEEVLRTASLKCFNIVLSSADVISGVTGKYTTLNGDMVNETHHEILTWALQATHSFIILSEL